MRKQPIVALIYDFDGTLSPGNMQEFGFIQAIGKKPQEFWQESDDIASGQDASNILSYMKLMFDEARTAGIKLRRDDFKRFGASVELFPGVLEWFQNVNAYGKRAHNPDAYADFDDGHQALVASAANREAFNQMIFRDFDI